MADTANACTSAIWIVKPHVLLPTSILADSEPAEDSAPDPPKPASPMPRPPHRPNVPVANRTMYRFCLRCAKHTGLRRFLYRVERLAEESIAAQSDHQPPQSGRIISYDERSIIANINNVSLP